jgi:hypothetical protein
MTSIEARPTTAYNRRVAGKPKPAPQRMSRMFQPRLAPAQYRAFAKAAADAGLPLRPGCALSAFAKPARPRKTDDVLE